MKSGNVSPSQVVRAIEQQNANIETWYEQAERRVEGLRKKFSHLLSGGTYGCSSSNRKD